MHCGVMVTGYNQGDWGRLMQGDYDRPPTVSDAENMDNTLYLGELVEPLGFDSIWATEHYGSAYSMQPNPLQYLAYWAGRTSRVDMGTAVIVAPWWNPVRLASELSMLDILLKGRRLHLGIGRGIAPHEYASLGYPIEQSHAYFYDVVNAIRAADGAERFTFDGQVYKIPPTTIRPQARHKGELTTRIKAAFTTQTSARLAAENGLGQMFVAGDNLDVMTAQVQQFNAIRAELGLPPDQPTTLLWMYCAETAAEAEEGWEYFYNQLKAAQHHYFEWNNPGFEGIHGYEEYLKRQRADVGAADASFAARRETQPIGTPDEIIDKIKTMQKAISLEMLIIHMFYGGMPRDKAEKSLRLFAEKVLPAVQAMPPQSIPPRWGRPCARVMRHEQEKAMRSGADYRQALGDGKAVAHTEPLPQYDAIIIGAGMSGMYQLYRLRQLGLSVRVFESGAGVGGTWYWNTYPGARFDSESYSYGYAFSEELLQEWSWSEHFAAQPETLRYLNMVADKFDLRKDIAFNSRVMAASYDDAANRWDITLEDGGRARGQFLITAIGILSAPQMPTIEGIDSFQGAAFHTSRWPHAPVDFTGKRVAVIGTGATGVQVIQEVAKTAGHLTVFQRTPNYCTPLHNSPIDDATQRRIKASYPEIFATCRASHGGFLHNADPRRALEVSPEERETFYEQKYAEPGFGIWMGNFRDIFVDQAANDTISEFIRNKIRQRVKDPAVAEKLIPKDHGFGTRRVPLETNYYEVYNQDNVLLVDVRETPIERITPTGIKTSATEYAFDMIIYATGFDAVTGAFDRIDIRGVGGQTLKDKWADGPVTYLGLQTAGFPNLLTLVGPHNAATFCNIPRCIEQNVDWVTELIRYMRDHDYTRVEPTVEAEAAWTEHVYELATRLLLSKVDSWFTGINRNLSGKQKRTFLLYSGGAPAYRDKCDEVAASGYEGFWLQR